MLYSQCRIFCIFFIIGILIALVFDFFRALRKTIKTNNIIIYIQDILFFIIISFFVINGIIIYSNGELRGYIFIAIFFGISIYALTISNLCVIIFKVILGIFKKVIIIIFSVPIKMVKIIYKKIANFKSK